MEWNPDYRKDQKALTSILTRIDERTKFTESINDGMGKPAPDREHPCLVPVKFLGRSLLYPKKQIIRKRGNGIIV